ncbi:hypothetical protein ASG90_13035 [Nocardioides sp. Soil797]|nr:hypothetical protein ASG90_13035 [Nocardioides sp. Soil797]
MTLGVGPTTSPAASSRLGRGVAVNLAGTVVSAIVQFAVAILITRGLSGIEAGILFTTTSIFFLANSVGQLGTQTGLVYFLPHHVGTGREDLVRGYLREALVVVTALAIAMALAACVLRDQISSAIFSDPATADKASDYLVPLAVMLPFMAIEFVSLAASRGLGTMRDYSLVELVTRPSLQLLLIIGVLIVGPQHLFSGAMASAWALPYMLAAAIAARLIWRRVRNFPRAPTWRAFPDRRIFWKYTAPRGATNVAQSAMQRFDIVLVAALAGPVEAAVYAAATRFIVLGQMVVNAINLAAQPGVAAALGREDVEAARHIYRTSTVWLMLITWPMYLTLLVGSPVLLQAFGSGYSTGESVIVVLALAMLISTALGQVDMVLAMSGRTSWNLLNALLALATLVAVDLVMIPGHGALGAAIGWGAAILVRNVAALIQVWLAVGMHPFGGSSLLVATLSTLTFAIIGGGTMTLLGENVGSIVVAVAGASVLHMALVWKLRRRLDLADLIAGLRKRRSRPTAV